jgi:hypothetical protein
MVSDFRKDAVLKLANCSEIAVWFISYFGGSCLHQEHYMKMLFWSKMHEYCMAWKK